MHVGHIGTDDQAGDIFTKAFTDLIKWDTLCKLVGLYDINVFRSHLGSSSSGKAKASCLRDLRSQSSATMAAQYSSVGRKAYAKDSTWAGSAQADADG